jgi:hypothetical protein
MTAAAREPEHPAGGRNPDHLAVLLEELALPDDAAELRHLVEVCRRSVRIRAWLFGRFANDPETQSAFRAVLNGAGPGLAAGAVWSPGLQRQVLSGVGPTGDQSGRFGGLTETEVLSLIKRYQAGRNDGRIFLLVRCWLRFLGNTGAAVPVALWRPTLQLWAELISDKHGRLLRQMLRAVQFLGERSNSGLGEADYGYTHSWKIHVLLFILERPQASYRMRELHRHLPVKFRHLPCKKIREFCIKHGIRRDARAGRPPTKKRRRHDGTPESPQPAWRVQSGSAASRRNLTAERKE